VVFEAKVFSPFIFDTGFFLLPILFLARKENTFFCGGSFSYTYYSILYIKQQKFPQIINFIVVLLVIFFLSNSNYFLVYLFYDCICLSFLN
jgi:hypothetical protein